MSISCDKENMRAWVAGLRSDRFAQGREYLARQDSDGQWKYCCMGVACEIAIESGLEMTVIQSGSTKSFDGAIGYLPLKVMDWLGLDSDNPYVDGVETRAIWANDTHGYTFAVIANGLEATYGLLEDGDDTPGTD